MTQRQKILMCPPDYFGVDYIINPWMEGNRGNTEKKRALHSWLHLKNALAQHASIILMEPQQGLPDLVFTANAGFLLEDLVIISRFRTKERQGEEPHFHHWFETNGFTILPWPQSLFFEGAGDALLDRSSPLIWLGYGFRTDEQAAPHLQKLVNRTVIPLHLKDPRFYHLDTCFCPLSDGYVMYYPKAFDEPSQERIRHHTNSTKLIEITEKDACDFACNTVEIDKNIFLNNASPHLIESLKNFGFNPHLTPLDDFMKAGGAAKCLTLKLIEH